MVFEDFNYSLDFTYISKVTIIDKLHEQKDIDEDLALGDSTNFAGSLSTRVKLILNSLSSLARSGLARQLKSLVKIWEVELKNEDGIGEVVGLAEFFELFG